MCLVSNLKIIQFNLWCLPCMENCGHFHNGTLEEAKKMLDYYFTWLIKCLQIVFNKSSDSFPVLFGMQTS